MFTRKTYILIGMLCLFGANINAQELKLSGKILDAENHQPLPFASLIIEKTNYSSISNDKGIFYFHAKKDVEYPINLQVSYVGYEKQSIKISKSDTSITVYMQPKGYALNEISVFAKQIFMASKNEISSSTLSSNQVRSLSGLTRDPFRSIQLLPGVSSNNETSAKYNVRGGNYDENIVLINGIEIYNPFHIKEAPMASVGIFNIDMVKSINFSAGGFNAEYGNALSSLLNIEYESGVNKPFEGKFDFNFLDMSVLARGSIGNRAGYNIGLRKCNLGYLLKASHVKPEIDMTYYDYQSQFDFQFSSDNKLKLNIIYSGDDYNQKADSKILTGSVYKSVNGSTDIARYVSNLRRPVIAKFRNLLVGVVSENKLSDNIDSKAYISLYNELEDESLLFDDEAKYSYTYNSNFWEIQTYKGNTTTLLETNTFSYKHDLTWKATPFFSLKTGFNYKNIGFSSYDVADLQKQLTSNIPVYPSVTVKDESDASSNDTSTVNLDTYRFEGYLQGTFNILNNLTLNTGVKG